MFFLHIFNWRFVKLVNDQGYLTELNFSMQINPSVMSTFNLVCFYNFSFSIHFSQCLLYEPIRGLFLTCAFAIKHAINRDLMETDGSIFPTIWLGALPTTLYFPPPPYFTKFPPGRGIIISGVWKVMSLNFSSCMLRLMRNCHLNEMMIMSVQITSSLLHFVCFYQPSFLPILNLPFIKWLQKWSHKCLMS